MDNNFYESNREARRKRNKKDNSPLSKVIVVQLALSLIFSAVLYGVCKTDTSLSQNIKAFYNEISKTDIAVSAIFGTLKDVVKQTLSPNIREENAQGETIENLSGEKAVFSPVFLTVKLENPIENGNITSSFGYRVSPITNEFSLHTGLDIAAPKNTKIYSIYDGVVEKADYNNVNGYYVVIKHSDNLKSTYNHCNKLLVKENETVKKGECIALVGETGYATGNHLHLEIILNNKYVNPLWVLNYDN